MEKELEQNTKFMIDFWNEGHDIKPMAVVKKGNKRLVFLLLIDDRENLKMILDRMLEFHPDTLIFICEGYTKKLEDAKNYKHGEMEKEFNNGSKDVKEIGIIQIYTKTGKIMRHIDKTTREIIDMNEFDGYLAINDVNRVLSIEDD